MNLGWKSGSGGRGPADVEKGVGLQRRAADEPAVDVGTGEQGRRIIRLDAAAIEDPECFGRAGIGGSDARSNMSVHGLGLLGRCRFAGADRPHGLIGDDQGSQVRLSAGAGFIVAICGEIMTMPGLPRVPSANHIRLDDNGQIEGLF